MLLSLLKSFKICKNKLMPIISNKIKTNYFFCASLSFTGPCSVELLPLQMTRKGNSNINIKRQSTQTKNIWGLRGNIKYDFADFV